MSIPKNSSFTAKKQVSKSGSFNTPVLSKLIDANSEEEVAACLPQSQLGLGTNDTDEEIDNSVNDLPQLILQNMVRVSQQDKKGHVLSHGVWMGLFLSISRYLCEYGIFK